MSLATFTETVLRRDRSVVLAGLGLIVLLSWAYLIYLAWGMSNMMVMSDPAWHGDGHGNGNAHRPALGCG